MRRFAQMLLRTSSESSNNFARNQVSVNAGSGLLAPSSPQCSRSTGSSKARTPYSHSVLETNLTVACKLCGSWHDTGCMEPQSSDFSSPTQIDLLKMYRFRLEAQSRLSIHSLLMRLPLYLRYHQQKSGPATLPRRCIQTHIRASLTSIKKWSGSSRHPWQHQMTATY